jgi:hypothetical protein
MLKIPQDKSIDNKQEYLMKLQTTVDKYKTSPFFHTYTSNINVLPYDISNNSSSIISCNEPIHTHSSDLTTQDPELTHVAQRSQSRSHPDPTMCTNFYKSLISSNTMIPVKIQTHSHLFRNISFPLLTSLPNGCRTKSSPKSLRNTNNNIWNHVGGNFCMFRFCRKLKKKKDSASFSCCFIDHGSICGGKYDSFEYILSSS